MKKSLYYGITVCLFSQCLLAGTASTSTASNSHDNDSAEYAIGLLANSTTSVYRGGENQTQLFPYFEWSWGPLFFQEGTFGSYLAGGEHWGLAASIGLDFLGDSERGDSDELADMNDLDDVISGGGCTMMTKQIDPGFRTPAKIDNRVEKPTGFAATQDKIQQGGKQRHWHQD